MGAHATHEIHDNSVAAYAALPHGERAREVYAIYEASSVPLSDREVLERLKQTDMNYVRPSITRMIDDGTLIELPKDCHIADPKTHRRVRVCTIARPRQRALDEILSTPGSG